MSRADAFLITWSCINAGRFGKLNWNADILTNYDRLTARFCNYAVICMSPPFCGTLGWIRYQSTEGAPAGGNSSVTCSCFISRSVNLTKPPTSLQMQFFPFLDVLIIYTHDWIPKDHCKVRGLCGSKHTPQFRRNDAIRWVCTTADVFMVLPSGLQLSGWGCIYMWGFVAPVMVWIILFFS